MIRPHRTGPEATSDLRTRYRPKSRIGHGLVSVAPWLDVLLVVFFYLLLESRLVLQPGVVVTLPQQPFTDGTRIGLIAVVLSQPGFEPGTREEVVFFDDERFVIDIPDQAARFGRALSARAAEAGGGALVIQSDERVSHGTVVRVVNMAMEAGIDKVNMATRSF